MKAGVITLGYVGHLWVVFATSSRSSTERHGDFSESVGFHFASYIGVFFGFGLSVVCVVVCCLVLCVCWWHLDYCLTFSLWRGNRQSKQDVLMTVWASSAHGTGKKKSFLPVFSLCGEVSWEALLATNLWSRRVDIIYIIWSGLLSGLVERGNVAKLISHVKVLCISVFKLPRLFDPQQDDAPMAISPCKGWRICLYLLSWFFVVACESM